MNLQNFHVIAVVSNPVRYKSRYQLMHEFMGRMKEYPVTFHMVETAYGKRPFEFEALGSDQKIIYHQFRSDSEIWQKESMINLAIQKLPSNWEYVAWVDADIAFIRPDVFKEAVHQLQHYSVIQLFSDCIDLGPHHEVIQHHKGFCFIYHQNRRVRRCYEFMHPGFAWAATRQAIGHLGGLLEAPLGAADHHMALALVGKAHLSVPAGVHPNYLKMVMDWQSKAEQYIRRNIGYVPGTIYHYWHGKKKDRKYVERWEILVKNKFDPAIHIKRNYQGLMELVDTHTNLRDDIREYFRARNEDSIDLE